MNKRFTWQLIITTILLTFIITACGQSTTTQESETAAEPETPRVNTAHNDTGSPASEDETDRPVNDGEIELNANGIEVGFTENGHPYYGNRNAPVLIEEFSDFQCPFCARFYEQTLPSITQNQITNGEVVIVFYDFPLTSLHPYAIPAANATRCAGEQSATAYWGMHDLLFSNGNAWANSNANAIFSDYAQQLELDTDKFDTCQSSNKYSVEIQSDLDLGRSRGVSSTPSFFVNEQPLVGAQPLSVFDQVIAAALNGEVVADQPSEAAQPAIAPTPATIPLDNIAGAMGDPDAPVTIVEYTDYQCPFCQRYAQETMPQLITEMIETGRVYYIMKDFPLDQLHPKARAAAAAARCAGEQDTFWEMHDAIFDFQSVWAEGDTDQILAGLAADLGLDMDAYNTCTDSHKYDEMIQANFEEGSRLGIRGTPAFFIDGFPVSGAQPFEMFEYGIGLAEEGTLAEAYIPREQPSQPTPVPPPSEPVEVPIGDAFSIGDLDAPVVIVEYTDFQCPFCSRHFQQTFPLIKEKYVDEGLVRYVFKDFPLTSIHPQAVGASMAARCAADQESYLEMHDLLFAQQGEWSSQRDASATYAGYAEQLGLDTAVFTQCMESNKYEAAVMADLEEGSNLGVRGTPAFFINGHFISGAQPFSVFEQAINQLLPQ